MPHLSVQSLSERISLGLSRRYRVDREIGAGAAATVYLAEDLRHKRNVAIKVLRPELGTTVAGERFLREIEIVAQLLHPHILGIIDSGEAEGLFFYVMPYVEGETLRQRLEREHDLPIDEALSIVRDVADALAYAHRRGVVHRDIKPENVLLFERHALVTDFGIARAIVSARHAKDAEYPHAARITAPGVSLGTPQYMAPEQAAGDADVDHRADLYALGILAYELLVGAPPFTGPTAQHVIAAQVARVPEPLSRVRRAIPVSLEKLVMRCLEKRPADRWQSAAEFVHALDAFASANTDEREADRREPMEHRFRLSEDVCRKLNRATLDPRIIGDEVHYLDNHVASDVLVLYLHGIGLDHTSWDAVLRESPYRGIAASLYGFAPASRRRIPLSIEDHSTIIRELLFDIVARERPTTTVLVGFSTGADLGFRVINDTVDRTLPIDGFLALGCNLALETCFVARPFAELGDDAKPSIDMLRDIDSHVLTVQEWMNLNDYLLRILRKFAGDLSALRGHAKDIIAAFIHAEECPFERWYREATTRVSVVRCVFEEVPVFARLVQAIRLRNLDHGVLGPRYREDSLVMEPATEHFGLTDPALVQRHVEAVLKDVTATRREPAAVASLRTTKESRIGA
ncbi:MAG TPA: serine/threonine-protein kinase [Gemmatimonadaceae bacterium]|nr:serine/threonine-protein kinase [Gemmatimonadaceae bacterium]